MARYIQRIIGKPASEDIIDPDTGEILIYAGHPINERAATALLKAVNEPRSCPQCGATPLIEVPSSFDPRDAECMRCGQITWDGS